MLKITYLRVCKRSKDSDLKMLTIQIKWKQVQIRLDKCRSTDGWYRTAL